MDWVDIPDKEIIKGCLENNRRSQELLYRKYATQMYHLCLAYAPREEAMDILQEAFFKVFRKINQFQKNGSLAGWIRRVVTNTAIDHYRSNLKNGVQVELTDVHTHELNAQPASEDIHYEDLLKVVNHLPESARMIFNLYALEGFTHKEIAEKLEISIGTSKSQFSRARKILSGYIEKYDLGD
ncbi:MAG: RNA polymerase sigma factor [Chlorobi bacterium]|nr:RNA polymerase sigma factor [Chlorobiota bacterium]